MNKEVLKKAFLHGVPTGAIAWFFYGLFASLFDDDSIFEMMFESSGIMFAVCITAAVVVFCYRNFTGNEDKKAKKS